MNSAFSLLANNINLPLIIYNDLGDVVFANKSCIHRALKNLIGERVTEIFPFIPLEDFFVDQKISNVVWQGDFFTLIISNWKQEGNTYYQCLLNHTEDKFFLNEVMHDQIDIPISAFSADCYLKYCNSAFNNKFLANNIEDKIHLTDIFDDKISGKVKRYSKDTNCRNVHKYELIKYLSSDFKKEADYILMLSKLTRADNSEAIIAVFINLNDIYPLISSKDDSEIKYKLLCRYLLSVQDSDRANLARELHDDLGQLLIALKISNFNAFIQKDCDISKKILSEQMPLFDQAINSLRDITKGLHPRFIRELGLTESLSNLINQISNLTDAKIELDISSQIKIKNKDIQYACYRICQEALNNAIKYSQAKKIYIGIESRSSYFKLVISDNGKGFDMSERSESLGLLSMQERVEQTGGDLRVNSKLGFGTRIQVIWTLTHEE